MKSYVEIFYRHNGFEQLHEQGFPIYNGMVHLFVVPRPLAMIPSRQNANLSEDFLLALPNHALFCVQNLQVHVIRFHTIYASLPQCHTTTTSN
ncbi:MAG: hypothetical protein Ta2A_12610 [Treponemataceae bacterium]|nr:MAG: hypothetical protein Ta2A_12610 [Treponemataceae bacterium]